MTVRVIGSIISWCASIILLVSSVGCSKAQSVVLAKKTTLRAHQPMTLPASKPLRVAGSHNDVVLEVHSSDFVNSSMPYGIRRSDGVVVQLAAVLLREDGTADTLSRSGYMGNQLLTIAPEFGQSLHAPYVALRITASDSITLNRIVWFSRPID
jgi:hypothetical protein